MTDQAKTGRGPAPQAPRRMGPLAALLTLLVLVVTGLAASQAGASAATSAPKAPSAESAYDAKAGQCVYGGAAKTAYWYIEKCQVGNFRVLKTLDGTTSTKGCPEPKNAYGLATETYSYSGESSRDKVLCIHMNYPGHPHAVADAGLKACLKKAGKNFTVVACAKANAILTGKVGKYKDAKFCGTDGWVSWENKTFPNFAYTVCWRAHKA